MKLLVVYGDLLGDDIRLLQEIVEEKAQEPSSPEWACERKALLEAIEHRLEQLERAARGEVDLEAAHLSFPLPPENPVAALAEATFREHLPQLLAAKPGWWVAYHGSRQVGIARSDLELYKLGQKQHIPSGEYIVRPIEPDPPDVIFFRDFPNWSASCNTQISPSVK
jgi:hypothetical protein